MGQLQFSSSAHCYSVAATPLALYLHKYVYVVPILQHIIQL